MPDNQKIVTVEGQEWELSPNVETLEREGDEFVARYKPQEARGDLDTMRTLGVLLEPDLPETNWRSPRHVFTEGCPCACCFAFGAGLLPEESTHPATSR